jgi:modulator of FtsH protease
MSLSPAAASKLISKKGGFMTAVICIMLSQLLLTAGVFMYLRNHHIEYTQTTFAFFSAFIVMLLLVVLMMMPFPTPVKFAFFCLFSVCQGWFLSSLSRIPLDVLKAALVSTMTVFVLMFVAGAAIAAAGIDLGWMGMILFAILLGLLATYISMLFVELPHVAHKAVIYIGIVLFTAYIVFDTNRLLLSDIFDPVEGALKYYLDFMNLFLNILGLNN